MDKCLLTPAHQALFRRAPRTRNAYPHWRLTVVISTFIVTVTAW
jgi:hypothetical protein